MSSSFCSNYTELSLFSPLRRNESSGQHSIHGLSKSSLQLKSAFHSSSVSRLPFSSSAPGPHWDVMSNREGLKTKRLAPWSEEHWLIWMTKQAELARCIGTQEAHCCYGGKEWDAVLFCALIWDAIVPLCHIHTISCLLVTPSQVIRSWCLVFVETVLERYRFSFMVILDLLLLMNPGVMLLGSKTYKWICELATNLQRVKLKLPKNHARERDNQFECLA